MSSITKKKHKKHRAYSRSHVEILLRVRQFFEKEKAEGKPINVNQVLQRTSAATGIGRSLCSSIKTDKDVETWPREDGQKVSCSRESSVPDSYVAIIRQVVRQILLEKVKAPTVDEVFSRVSKLSAADVTDLNLFEETVPPFESSIWTWSRATLHRFMQRSGFVYEDRVTHYEVSKSRADVISMRDNYLEWIEQYREEEYDILFQDETWVFKNLCCRKAWKDTRSESTSGVLKVPSGTGERSILSHVLSETDGLLHECMLLYRGSKANKDADYHSEMNWDVFSRWCENTVFPAIESRGKKSVLVLDRATYHTKLDEEDRRPTSAWNKNRLVCAIERWGDAPAEWPEDWRKLKRKSQLLEYARSIYPAPKYKIQKIADKFSTDEFDIKILFLPVAHPELNPIEMVWSFVKRAVASRNLHFTLTHVENVTKTLMQGLTSSDIHGYVRHAQSEENKYRELSELVDNDDDE